MKRPILIATIGFLIGIVWGLYFNIVSFLLILLSTYLCLYIIKFKKIRFIRIIKLFVTRKAIILFTVFSLISNIYIKYLEKDYCEIYNSLEKVQCVGTIISDREEKDFSYQYKIKIEKINNKKVKNKNFYILINKKDNTTIKFADEIIFKGEYIKPEVQRNYKGFDYSRYLKSNGIYGTVKIEGDIRKVKDKNLNYISYISHKLRNKIIENTNRIFAYKLRGIFLGILIGYDELVTDEVKDNFSNSNLSHLLAVSGMHVTYVILGLTIALKKLKIPKEKCKTITCILLVFYLYIINFTPSVTRAVIMSVIAIMQIVLQRKQDIATTISFSSLLILISNPYKVLNIGFILSYAGTIGIIFFENKFEKIKEFDIKIMIIKTLKNMCFVTVSAWLLIFPITLYYFNKISLTFIISNLIAGILIGPITMIGLIIIFVSFINIRLVAIIVKIYSVLLLLLLKCTKIIAQIPISNIYVKTPNILIIVLYYIIILAVIIIFIIQKSNRIYLNRKLNCIKIKLKNNLFKSIIFILIISIIIFIFDKFPKNLKIYFVDVGQGDCTLVVTPQNKKIIIDSGGSESYDVGKNTLLPYLLDRGVTKIDYIIISHFDTDHCKGFEYVMNNLKVKNIIIPNQSEDSDNYQAFFKIVKSKGINVIFVDKGNKFNIEKDLYFYVLWPDKNNFVDENALNNNSLVGKLYYKKFSILFTGDIEKIAEEQILKRYENSNVLKSTILKVAHHGSKSSSTKNFLNIINPKIALIGVGNNNKFGHPNDEVLERLKRLRN